MREINASLHHEISLCKFATAPSQLMGNHDMMRGQSKCRNTHSEVYQHHLNTINGTGLIKEHIRIWPSIQWGENQL